MFGQPDYRRMRAELANAGFGCLLIGAMVLGVVVLMVFEAGPLIATGMIIGGMAGLIFTLLFPGNPARFGYRFARFPKQLSPHEQELTAHVARLRKPWLMVFVNIPYFLALIAYRLSLYRPWMTTDLGSQITAAFFSMAYVVAIAWGTQYVQVLWSLRRESRAGRDRQ